MKKIFGCLIITISLLFSNVNGFHTYAVVKEIQALNDAYVEEANPTQNFGSMGHLGIKSASGSNSNVFLQFETINVKPGDYKIELKLYCTMIYPEGVTESDINIFSTDDSVWSEGKINWNNTPKLNAEIARGKAVKGKTTSFDVSAYVMEARMKKKPVTFAVVDSKNTGRAIVLSSKQGGNADFFPMLVLDTDKKPEPISIPATPIPTPSVNTPTTASPSSTATPNPDEVNKHQNPSEKVNINSNINIEDYTTTRTAPWMVNLHLTSPQQVAAGIKGGESAQMVWAMDVSKTNPRMLLLGSDTAGIYKSTDGGKTWNFSDKGFGLMGTADIAFDPDDENIAYVLANPNNNGAPAVSAFSGVWKSVDGGNSWNQVLKTHYVRKGTNKLIKFGNRDRFGKRKIYVGSHGKGVYVSSDGGATWDNMGLDGELQYDINYDEKDAILVVACEKSGVMVSDDDGNTWQPRNEGLPTKFVKSIAINPSDNKHWIIICDNKLFESKDSGSTWKDLEVSHNDMASTAVFCKLLFGAPDKEGKARLYMVMANTQYSMRYSVDYGKTFQKPIVHNQLAFIKDNWGYMNEAFTVHPTDPNTVWVPLDTDIFKSTDGGVNLEFSSSGYSGFRATNFLFDKNNDKNIFITFIDRGLVRSVDYGGSEKYPMFEYLMEDRYGPRYMSQKTVGAIARDPNDINHLFIAVGDWGSNKIISESTDGGYNFKKIFGTEGMSPLIIQYHPQDSSVIYAGKLISYDGGKTWNKVMYNIAAVSPKNGDVIWGRAGDLIYMSSNRGKDWQPLNIKISGVQIMEADLFVENRIWIGSFASGLYRADGETVTNFSVKNGFIKSASGSLPIYDVAQDPKNQMHLVAGGTDNQGFTPSAGLFETYDGGETWKVVDGMEGSKDIWKVAFHPNLPQVYISTSNGTFVYEYDKYFDRTKTMFNDIENHWAKQTIENMSKIGIVKGFQDGSFKPDDGITRAQFTEMLIRGLKTEKVDISVPTFSDVNETDWCYKSIEMAVKSGYLAGADFGRFLPNNNITHEQIATIIYRVLNLKNIVPSNNTLEKEIDEVSDWAKEAVIFCANSGIINTDGSVAFTAKKSATRAEALAMLEELLKKLS